MLILFIFIALKVLQPHQKNVEHAIFKVMIFLEAFPIKIQLKIFAFGYKPLNQ